MLGTGTIDNPYLISTPNDLQAINSNLTAYYELANDIDMTSVSFTPIGRSYPFYQAHLDGKGYKITNLRIVSSIQYTALIARTNGGDIKNLGLENVYIEANTDDVGGLIGLNSLSNFISNCYVTGTVKQTNTSKNYVGGLIARNLGIVNNCYTDCTVTGGNNVGGMFGSVLDYNDSIHITNSYSKSTVSGVSNVGSLVGNAGTITVYENNYYNSDLSSNPIVSGVTGKTTNEMQQQSTYTNWDFTNTWFMNGYPALRVFAGEIVLPKVETITVNSYSNDFIGNVGKTIKSTKQTDSFIHTILTHTDRHIATSRIIDNYLLPIHSNVSQSHRTVRSSTETVVTFLNPISASVERKTKTFKNLLSFVSPILGGINIFPVDSRIYKATTIVIENPSNGFVMDNMSTMNYIENPSYSEVIE